MKLQTPILAAAIALLAGPVFAQAQGFLDRAAWRAMYPTHGKAAEGNDDELRAATGIRRGYGQNRSGMLNSADNRDVRRDYFERAGGFGTIHWSVADIVDEGRFVTYLTDETGEKIKGTRQVFAKVGHSANNLDQTITWDGVDLDGFGIVGKTGRRNGWSWGDIEATANCAPNVRGIRSAMSGNRTAARSERRENRGGGKGKGNSGKGRNR